MLSFEALLGFALFLGLKLANFGTAGSLALAMIIVRVEVSGEW